MFVQYTYNYFTNDMEHLMRISVVPTPTIEVYSIFQHVLGTRSGVKVVRIQDDQLANLLPIDFLYNLNEI